MDSADRQVALEEASEASERELGLVDMIWPADVASQHAAFIADAMIDQRVPAMIAEAMRDPVIVANAILAMEPAARETLRVLLDMLADQGG